MYVIKIITLSKAAVGNMSIAKCNSKLNAEYLPAVSHISLSTYENNKVAGTKIIVEEIDYILF